MADNWKDLVTLYHGTIGQAAEIVRRHPRASKFRKHVDWLDLEKKLGHVHQLYVKGKITYITVHKNDQQTFRNLSENLERSRVYLDVSLPEDDALDQALADLHQNSVALLNTGPHGPIEGRPDFAEEEVDTHGSTEGRPDSDEGGKKRGA